MNNRECITFLLASSIEPEEQAPADPCRQPSETAINDTIPSHVKTLFSVKETVPKALVSLSYGNPKAINLRGPETGPRKN